MKHARPDYQRIQDPEHKIPEAEPVFLLRGQDGSAPHAIRVWAADAKARGARGDIIKAALDQADAMLRWQREHGAKVPDL
jgi:hypothetical protein